MVPTPKVAQNCGLRCTRNAAAVCKAVMANESEVERLTAKTKSHVGCHERLPLAAQGPPPTCLLPRGLKHSIVGYQPDRRRSPSAAAGTIACSQGAFVSGCRSKSGPRGAAGADPRGSVCARERACGPLPERRKQTDNMAMGWHGPGCSPRALGSPRRLGAAVAAAAGRGWSRGSARGLAAAAATVKRSTTFSQRNGASDTSQ